MHSNTYGIDEWKMRPMSAKCVLHYELDLPNMRIHDLHHQLMMTYFMRIFHIFLLRFHSSEIRGLCLMKWPRATFHFHDTM